MAGREGDGGGSSGSRRDRELLGEGRSAAAALSTPTERLPLSVLARPPAGAVSGLRVAEGRTGAGAGAEVGAGAEAGARAVAAAGAPGSEVTVSAGPSRCAPSEPGSRPAPRDASRPTPLGFRRIAIEVMPRPTGIDGRASPAGAWRRRARAQRLTDRVRDETTKHGPAQSGARFMMHSRILLTELGLR